MAESSDFVSQSAQGVTRHLKGYALRFFIRFNLTENHFLVALAMVVGIGGGFGSILFQRLLELTVFWLSSLGQVLPSYALPLIPAIGGLAAGLLVYFFAQEAKGAGVSEVMNAIVTRQGVIRGRVGVVKALASALTLGSGGSAGSEGPIVQIGAAWGSGLGKIFKFSENNLKLLIACGSAAGISAIFNAPIAGVLFALEVILGDFTIAAFTPVVVSSVLSAVVAQAYRGDRPVFEVPDYHFVSAFELGWFVLLAVLVGIVGVLFIRVIYGAEDFFEKIDWLPEWFKPAIGGALVGGIGLGYPEVMGVGYRTVETALQGNIVMPVLLVLLGGKLLTTSMTISTGGSGGFFAPSLFIGATLGGAVGRFAEAYLPGTVSTPGAYALVGMGAMVAGTTHAPLTAMLMIFEMTGSYHIILPLMVATILAVIVARSIERESIYSLKLARRGIRIHQGRDLSVLEKIPVSQIMRTDYDFVREHMPLGEIVGLIQHGSLHDFPVVDHNGQFLGMIWFHDIREVMLENDMYALLIAEDVLGDPLPRMLPRSSLADALILFTGSDADTLPIVRSVSEDRLAGVITRADLMRCYEQELLLSERNIVRT